MTAASLGAVDRLRELIGKYWGLAYAEGKEGRDTDTPGGDAARTWSEIEACLRALTPAAGVPVATITHSADALSAMTMLPAAFALGYGTHNLFAAPAPPPADAVRALVGKASDALERMGANIYDPSCEAAADLWAVKQAFAALQSAAPAGDEPEFDFHDTGDDYCRQCGCAYTYAAAPTPEGAKQRKDCEAPCIFCNYSGEGYWQKFTHARYCPWYWVGGMNERRDIMQTITIPEANRHDR